MNTLLAQYLQLVDPPALALPDNVADPSIQASIAAHMFRDSPDRPLPPISYQTRVLKRILARIEESAGPEDEIIEPLLNAFTSLLSRPKPSPLQQAQELAYTTYTAPFPEPEPTAPPAPADHHPRTVTTTESKSLLLSSGTTGLRTWEAALHLGTFLASTAEGAALVRGKRVVELGAGTGFLSLFCARHLAVQSVVATDCEDALVHNIGRCVELNRLDASRIVPAVWGWGTALEAPGAGSRELGLGFDVALGADLIYDTDLIPPLISTLRDLFENYRLQTFIISATLRNEDTFGAFLNACESNRLSVERLPFESPPEQGQSGFFHSTAVPIRTYQIRGSV
ncbi:hypothetical protein PHISP_05312 [Aspergillus sp. HF37]|nr:hypothetical protein PHISP_05312 [Aspergillus sp. HF37]